MPIAKKGANRGALRLQRIMMNNMPKKTENPAPAQVVMLGYAVLE
jgi:hypothetical protein